MAGDVSSSPLQVYRTTVAESWIDYNGHMNEGYYAVAFGDASDAYLIQSGFDAEYRTVEGGTFYTVESHIRYLREVGLGDPIAFHTTVLGADPRKLHLFHSMVHETAGFEAATQEVFLLHVDMASVKVSPMGADLFAAIEHDRAAHELLEPTAAGQAIRPIRRSD